ncbi:MAG: hypothetical protein KatS3mg091_399 [Patescibacteria group bacterium]|nr:MAG: hypothetical protein KatS3mg091_399 [Patescibacteria group bacterium]
MALKQFAIDFAELREDLYLRNDVKFHYFLYSSNWNLFMLQNKKLISLKNILKDDYNLFEYKDNEEYRGVPTGQQYLDEDGEIIDYLTVSKDDHPKRLKYKVSNKNILLSSLRLAKSPALYFENKDLSKYVFSNGFYIFKVDINWNKKFVLYILRTKRLKNVLDNHIYRGIGISAYKKEDLLKIKIPLIPKPQQDAIVAQIEPIEKEIKQLKSQLKDPQEIINKVFAREFGFDEYLYKEFGKGMTSGTQIAPSRKLRVFETDFKEFAKSNILRFSTRFHNPPTKKLMNILNNINTIKVKNVIQSYEKGIQPKYNSNGEIPVIKISNLKNGFIDFSETEFVTKEYYNSLSEKKKLKKNDIIICVTGKVSLGKIDYYEYEQKAITTVDNYILTLKNNYNPLFFTYFFRSILGYFQIERDYTGTTNQIHLYWDQISNFKIPNISLTKQQQIVDEIKAELDEQERIKAKIQKLRDEIDQIIEKAIQN